MFWSSFLPSFLPPSFILFQVTKKAGRAASFPAIELPERIMMYPDLDEMVSYMATRYRIDVKSLYLYNDYVQGVYPRYIKMMDYMIKGTGGWPQVFPALGIKSILVIGATGMIGSRIVCEVALRGHRVVRASRNFPAKSQAELFAKKIEPFLDVKLDANDTASIVKALDGIDVVVCALGPARVVPEGTKATPLVDTWKAIVAACSETGKRVIFVGGAGSLLVEGKKIIDYDWFPEAIKNEARQHVEALEYLKSLSMFSGGNWTVATPPKMIQPGMKTGKVVSGYDDSVGDQISAEDFAAAVVDEIEAEKYKNTRFTVANENIKSA